MIKTSRIAGFLLFLAIAGTTVSEAQNSLQQQQQQEQIEVGDEELAHFAKAFQGVRMINQQAQQEMATLVQDEGMDIQRFNEIHKATIDPSVEVDATEEEKEQHQKIAGEIEKMQIAFQGNLEEVIENEGMTVERYQQIATKLQTDPELQERLRETFES